jgi:three-Cys-motif partner protein
MGQLGTVFPRMPKLDLADYAGREQAFIKHSLLRNYLPDWGYKTGSTWDNLIFIDGFAGPWKVQDENLSDSSFSIAINALRDLQNGLHQKGRAVKVRSILVERTKIGFKRLTDFAAQNSSRNFDVHALSGKFVDKLPEIDVLINKSTGKAFKFVFLDPKGWVDIPMQTMVPLLKSRSCEVLINVMARHIVRFLEQEDRSGSYNAFFGRSEARAVINKTPKSLKLRVILDEYCKSLKTLCDFKYVSSAAILEPNEEAIRYFLVFGTNHIRGIEVFKAAEQVAAKIQDKVRFETIFKQPSQEFMTLGGETPKTRIVYRTRDDFLTIAMIRVIQNLLAKPNSEGLSYHDVYATAMELPLVFPKDLQAAIEQLPCIRLALDGKRRRVSSPEESTLDRLFVANRDTLVRELSKLEGPINDCYSTQSDLWDSPPPQPGI